MLEVSTVAAPIPPLAPAPHFAFYRVAPECVDLMWPQVEPHFTRAVRLEHGRFTTRDIHKWCLSGDQQLWIGTVGGHVICAALIKFYVHPTGKRGSLAHLLGGSLAGAHYPFASRSQLKQWVTQGLAAWTEICRLQGITEMHIMGRPAWLRYVKPYGFEQAAIVLTREEI